MFGNYSERDVDGGFYYRNPDGRSGVFTIGDYRAVGNVDGTCSYGTGASGQVDPSNYAVRDAIMADPSCFLMNEIAPGGYTCLLYTSPSPRDRQKSRMPSSA